MRIQAILAGAAIMLAASNANAATLVHPTKATHADEHGVMVWRGAKAMVPAAAALKERDGGCRDIRIVVNYALPWSPRHLRVHKVFEDDEFGSLAHRRATQGFWSDRMRAGL